MKSKEKKELLEKSVEELSKMVAETRAKLASYRIEHGQGKLADKRVLSKTQDDIARMLTIMRVKAQKGENNA